MQKQNSMNNTKKTEKTPERLRGYLTHFAESNKQYY